MLLDQTGDHNDIINNTDIKHEKIWMRSSQYTTTNQWGCYPSEAYYWSHHFWLPPLPQSQGKEFMNTLLYFIYNINLYLDCVLINILQLYTLGLEILRLDFLGSNQTPLLRNQLWQFLCFSIVKAFVSGHVNSVLSHALTPLNKRAIYWLMCLLSSMCKTSNW